jgi:hypothetical protein
MCRDFEFLLDEGHARNAISSSQIEDLLDALDLTEDIALRPAISEILVNPAFGLGPPPSPSLPTHPLRFRNSAPDPTEVLFSG